MHILCWRNYILPKENEILLVLIQKTAEYQNIPEEAVKKDLLLCRILDKLSNSFYKESCIFKGGTSLSKCYPHTIERFSEDIDLTYIPTIGESDGNISSKLKEVEKVLADGFVLEKIGDERSNRNKSAYVIDKSSDGENRIKLEIGSSVRPEPYSCFTIKSYVQTYLECLPNGEGLKYLEPLGLRSTQVNSVHIERTFLDKVFAVKRHSIEGSINGKARHLYDITKLWQHEKIQEFVKDTVTLKEMVQITKETDKQYLSGKRKCVS